MSGRERPATCCRPPRKPTRNEVQRATTSDGDCCDGGEDSNGEDSNRDSEDSNGDGEDSNGDGNGDGNDGSGDDELQRRRAVHFSTPGQKSPKQNRTHGPSAVKHSKPAGFRDLKTLPENFAALRHGTFFHLRSRTNSGGNRSRHECCTPSRQWKKGGSGSFPNPEI